MNVVWLHGFPLGPAMWDPQLTAFGGIAPHLISPEADTVDAMADLALAAADDAGYERFSVVGLSMGGYVAFRLLDRVPRRIESLVLADTRAEPDTVEGKAARDRLIQDLAREGPEAATAFLKSELDDRNPDLYRFALAMARGHEPEALSAALRAMRNRPDSRPILRRIAVPTLVANGDRDSLVSEPQARALAEGISRARLVVVEDAGHFSNLESPEEFNLHVGAFLQATLAALRR